MPIFQDLYESIILQEFSARPVWLTASTSVAANTTSSVIDYTVADDYVLVVLEAITGSGLTNNAFNLFINADGRNLDPVTGDTPTTGTNSGRLVSGMIGASFRPNIATIAYTNLTVAVANTTGSADNFQITLRCVEIRDEDFRLFMKVLKERYGKFELTSESRPALRPHDEYKDEEHITPWLAGPAP